MFDFKIRHKAIELKGVYFSFPSDKINKNFYLFFILRNLPPRFRRAEYKTPRKVNGIKSFAIYVQASFFILLRRPHHNARIFFFPLLLHYI